jgi:hypothetical protein
MAGMNVIRYLLEIDRRYAPNTIMAVAMGAVGARAAQA